MSFGDFLSQIIAGGEGSVAHPSAGPVAVDGGVLELLERLDGTTRLEFPCQPPRFDERAAAWAARLVYGLSQCFVYRELDAGFIADLSADPCPAPMSPSTVYSVDLCLRLLPDLHRLARAISDEDPLTKQLLELARTWPLSSVGIPLDGDIDISGFFEHDSLRLVYVDRIFERSDVSRLRDPLVASAVRGAMGAYPDLAPAAIRLALEQAPKGA